ncbi:CapA family protein [Candidatus Poriferisocius sp.]|uniref:CapA family protein n=1 Tax=Candidatus Poriferisocius sp. TaxID=3101276 RepID=UPI003B51D1EA
MLHSASRGLAAALLVATVAAAGGCAGDDLATGPLPASPTVPAIATGTDEPVPTAHPTPTAASRSTAAPHPDATPSPSSEAAPTPAPVQESTEVSTPAPAQESTAAPTATPMPAPRQARLAFTGDLLSHSPVFRQAQANGNDDLDFDYRPMFEPVRATLSDADLAICHLETPLSPDNRNLSGYPLFNAPGDLASAIAEVGYDGCSTASNHSLDQGTGGIIATLNLFDEADLGHAGMARTPQEAATPTLYEVNGITIGHLSYTYGLNGLILPDDQTWAVNVISTDDILAEARAAIGAGADFVVLSIQWGAEYRVAPTEQQRALAKELLAGDEIDLIVGTHAHVIQPVEFIGGNYVIYGLGNFLSNQSPQSCRSCPLESADGVIVQVDLVEGESGDIRVASIGAVPTWVDRRTFTIIDVGAALAGNSFPELTSQLEQSLARTSSTLRSYGVDVWVATSGTPDAG